MENQDHAPPVVAAQEPHVANADHAPAANETQAHIAPHAENVQPAVPHQEQVAPANPDPSVTLVPTEPTSSAPAHDAAHAAPTHAAEPIHAAPVHADPSVNVVSTEPNLAAPVPVAPAHDTTHAAPAYDAIQAPAHDATHAPPAHDATHAVPAHAEPTPTLASVPAQDPTHAAAVPAVVPAVIPASSAPVAAPAQDATHAAPQTTANANVAAASSSSAGSVPASGIYITPDADRPIEVAATGFGSKKPTTVIEVFKETATRYTEKYALSVKRNGAWVHWNWGQYYNDAVQFARALIHLKFQPTQSVSILGFNSPEWFIADVGTIAAGGLAAGIYITNGPEACAYIIGHSKSSVVVVENEQQLKKILQVREKLPSVQAIVQWSGVVPTDMPGLVYSWEAFLKLGDNVNVAEVDARIAALKPSQACTLIYTSGTTGPPKAVMLSHDNLTYNAAASATAVALDHNEVVVSYLPLSHIAAQLVDMHGVMFLGGHVFFAQPDALKGTLGETLKEVRPTLFFGVPRVWEKIQETMVKIAKNNGGLKKKIGTWAKGVGHKGAKARQKKHGMPWGWTIANKLVFEKVRVALGLDKARFLATAAAPMPEETADFFLSLNIIIVDVYGMSEVSGPTTITPTSTFRPGSIGQPVPGIEVRIDKPDEKGNGEICWKGRSSFLGYMYNEKETRETFDAQGWLHTGDIGRLDEQNYVYITGRIKELIITAGGENISPSLIEDDMKLDLGGVVSNIMVVGDKRKFLGALITLRTDPAENPAEGQYSLTDNLSKEVLSVLQSIGSSSKTVQEAKNDAALKKWISENIAHHNKRSVSTAQQIRAFAILDQDFTIDNETLTPTMKLKRRIVLQKYAKEIDEMYAIAEKEFEAKA